MRYNGRSSSAAVLVDNNSRPHPCKPPSARSRYSARCPEFMTIGVPASRNVGILALQGDFREHREMLARMGHQASEVRKPSQLEPLDALIIPGGESTTIARLILSNGFQGPLREFCAS